MEDALLLPGEAAAQLRASKRTVLDWLRKGKLKGVKVGGQWRIFQSSVDTFPRHPNPPESKDPFSDLNTAIAQGGECTRDSEKDQHHRDTQGREWTPPDIPE